MNKNIQRDFQIFISVPLNYKKGNDRKIFHSSAKLIANHSDIDEAFKSIHQSNMTKIKKICL